jgi:hypothetical protein
MAMLHEEVDAVLLEGDGIGIGLGHALDDLELFNVELETALGALVGADLAFDDDGGFLGEAFEGFKHFRGNTFDMGHALHGSGSVAKYGEQELAAFSEVIEPSVEGDGLAFKLAESGDGGSGNGLGCGGEFVGHGVYAFLKA